MTVKFLVIPRVMVSGFTYLANHVSAGLPSLTSLTGLGKSIELQCTRNNVPCEFTSVSIALRTPATNMGHARYSRATFADKSDLVDSEKEGKEGRFLAPSIEEQKGSMVLDLIVALTVDEAISPELSADFLTKVVRTQKFSGSEMRTLKGGPVTVKVFDTLAAAFASIPGSALMLEDASQTLTAYAQESQQSVKTALLELVSFERTDYSEAADSEADASEEVPSEEVPSDDTLTEDTSADVNTPEETSAAQEAVEATPSAEGTGTQQALRPAGYFVPAATGFALLEEPKVKRDSRAPGVPHAYAEPLLGMVRIRQVASVRAQVRRAVSDDLGETLPAVFWKTVIHQSEACPHGAVVSNGYA